MWDTSLKVPCAIRWPGVIKPGTRLSQTISNLDWFPTLLAMAKVKLPASITVRGRDFTPLLRGRVVPWNNELYAEYSMHHGAITHMRVWRTPSWKYMKDFASPGREELYDLSRDPGETKNLAASTRPEHVRIKSQLAQKILERMATLKDPARPAGK